MLLYEAAKHGDFQGSHFCLISPPALCFKLKLQEDVIAAKIWSGLRAGGNTQSPVTCVFSMDALISNSLLTVFAIKTGIWCKPVICVLSMGVRSAYLLLLTTW